MANYSILFHGSQDSKTQDCSIECFANVSNEIFIRICGASEEFIILDVPTAIKFAKTIRTEINKAKEVENG